MDYLSKIRVKGILTDQGIPEASQEHLTQGPILKLLSKMSEFPRIFARKTCELHSEKSQNLTWDHLTQGLGGNMDDIERAIAAMQRGTPTRAAVQHRIQDAVQVPNPNRMQFRVGVTVIDTWYNHRYMPPYGIINDSIPYGLMDVRLWSGCWRGTRSRSQRARVGPRLRLLVGW
jgi:hypothetical protein